MNPKDFFTSHAESNFRKMTYASKLTFHCSPDLPNTLRVTHSQRVGQARLYNRQAK